MTLSSMVVRGVQNQPRPVGLTNQPNLHPISTQTDVIVGRFWVSAPKARHWLVEWRVLFSKTQATLPNGGYIQIRQNRAQIWGDPTSSQPYLVRFSQIRPFPADFSYFEKRLGDFDADLVSFYIFRRWFCRFRGFFLRCRWPLKLRRRPETDRQTRSPPEPKIEPTDWRRQLVSSHSSFHPTTGGSGSTGLKIDPARPVDNPNGSLSY